MKEEAQAIAGEALSRAKEILRVDDVTVIIEENQDATIPETGVGGYTPDSYTIFVYINPQNVHLQVNLEKEIRSTVTHEYHHAVRNRAINWKTDTLLGALITEGLADHFDLEVNGGSPQPWSVALTNEEIEKAKHQATSEYEKRDYDHPAWFFGSKERGILKWTGYALGFKLVGDYLKASGKKASELVSTPASEFIR